MTTNLIYYHWDYEKFWRLYHNLNVVEFRGVDHTSLELVNAVSEKVMWFLDNNKSYSGGIYIDLNKNIIQRDDGLLKLRLKTDGGCSDGTPLNLYGWSEI